MIVATMLAVLLVAAAVIAAVLALGAAFGAAFAWAYTPVAAALYERRQRRSLAALQLPPSQTYRPWRPRDGDLLAEEIDEYWDAARKASAAAKAEAIPARHARPLAPLADTAVLPVNELVGGAR